MFIPKGRINFESGLGKQGKSPAFGSVVIKLEDENSIEYIDLSKVKETSKIVDVEEATGVVNSTYISAPVQQKKPWYM